MNFEKIGQFLGGVFLFGALTAWYKVDNWPIQFTVIFVLSGIFLIWAGSNLQEKLERRRVSAQYENEDRESNND
jgi:hypothetical protein